MKLLIFRLQARLSSIRHSSFAFLVVRIALKTFPKSQVLKKFFFHLSPEKQRLTKSLSIFSRIIEESGGCPSSLLRALESKNVLELGCGGFGGAGPMVLAAGSKSYCGIDPSFPTTKRNDLPIWFQQHLKRSLEANKFRLAKLYGVKEAPSDVYFKADYLAGTIEEMEPKPESFDFCLSISCLEHITNLDGTLVRLSQFVAKACDHFHVVNFGNHLSKKDPFAGIYSQRRGKFAASTNRSINELRASEVISLFNKVFENCIFLPIDKDSRLLPQVIHEDWLDQFTLSDLSTRVGIVVSVDVFDQIWGKNNR